jgi:peptidoglycan/xylan/chitin deacetylase (PgdA/CDA1 family)
VLLYHRFDEDRFTTTTTSSAQFEQHMAYLKSHGYIVISMDQLADCVEGKRTVPEKAVVITIDDGFISEYDKAIPILQKYRYPFCIFVFTRAVGVRGYVSWPQLKRIESLGGVVGCHTHTHPRLINLPEREMIPETVGSKELMERNLGHKVRYFAYPYGQYDEKVREIARRAGFRLMLTSDPGSVGAGTESDRVPRQAVVGAEMDINDFIGKLNNPPLVVARRVPVGGTLPSNTLSGISLTLKDPGLYDPHQINLFLSEKKRLPARFDPATGVLSCTGPFHLTRKTNRIIVSARRKSDGLFALDAYLIVLPGMWEGMRYTLR